MPLTIEYRMPVLPAPMARAPEAAPFRARLMRGRQPSLAGALRRTSPRRHSRTIGIAATIALGLVLGPIGWGAGGIDPARAQGAGDALQPFERAGENFPGSAFYYLDANDTGLVAPSAAAAAWRSQAEPGAAEPIAGLAIPAARPVSLAGTGLDRARALQCLTTAIYYEAATEPDAGQRAVAQVVLNRVAHPSYPGSVCGVVYQGSERRTGCQFSFTCDGSLARQPARFWWERARRVASEALGGAVYAPVGTATHYHTTQIHPYWADSLDSVGVIGAHIFYRFPGAAGRPTAFATRYIGGEPLPAPNPRTLIDEAPAVADPAALARAFEQARSEAQALAAVPVTAAAPAPAPSYAAPVEARGGEALYRADRLPGSGAVLPEWENSGRWIAQPGS